MRIARGWGAAQYPVLLPGTAVTLTSAGDASITPSTTTRDHESRHPAPRGQRRAGGYRAAVPGQRAASIQRNHRFWTVRTIVTLRTPISAAMNTRASRFPVWKPSP
jgi:hypothetical protein